MREDLKAQEVERQNENVLYIMIYFDRIEAFKYWDCSTSKQSRLRYRKHSESLKIVIQGSKLCAMRSAAPAINLRIPSFVSAHRWISLHVDRT